MSVQLIAWALEQPTGSVTRKAVLICLANRANSDTGLCCPSIAKIAAETELNRATVIRAIDSLIAHGLLVKVERHRENGSQTSNEYRFPSRVVRPPPSQSATPPRRTARPPEPELRTRSEPIAAAPRKRNEVWDALVVMFGEPTTPSSKTKRGKVTKELREAGATYDEILARGKRWPLHFDNATLTETALIQHWDRLGRKPLRAGGR